jgi:hypothetical protein
MYSHSFGTSSSETLVIVYQTIQCYIPEDSRLHLFPWEPQISPAFLTINFIPGTSNYLPDEELNTFMHKVSKEYMFANMEDAKVNIKVWNNVKYNFKLFQYLHLRFTVQIICFISFRVVLSKHRRVSLAFWSWSYILAETHQMHFSWSCSYCR